MRTVVTNDIVRRTMTILNMMIRVVFPPSSDPLSPIKSEEDIIACLYPTPQQSRAPQPVTIIFDSQ